MAEISNDIKIGLQWLRGQIGSRPPEDLARAADAIEDALRNPVPIGQTELSGKAVDALNAREESSHVSDEAVEAAAIALASSIGDEFASLPKTRSEAHLTEFPSQEEYRDHARAALTGSEPG